MRRALTRVARWLALAGACACGQTGRDYVEIPLFTRGTAARPVNVAGGTLTLSEARVALGPLYLCATESAESALCETALAEWLELLTIDALSARPTHVGEMSAVTGSVRSAFFDYGMSWLLTKPAPAFPVGAALAHSAELRFRVRRGDGGELNVRADIDLAPIAPGDAAVNGRKTAHTIDATPVPLTLQLDANAWLERVRVEDLSALDDDGDGEITLAPGAQAYEAIVQGMTARAPPTFLWGE